MYFYHNSRDVGYRSPYGAAPVGASVTLRADADLPWGSRVYARFWRDSELRILMLPDVSGHLSCTMRLPEEPGLYWYYFELETPGGKYYYGRAEGAMGGGGSVMDREPGGWQITVYSPQKLPGWYAGGMAYQIFPDRFRRGKDWEKRQKAAAHPAHWKGSKRIVLQDWEDTPFYCKDHTGRVTRWPFFGGTLAGIEEKLPYLRSLGVRMIYLNPIFLASSNHKYDTADYMTVDPGFGDEKAFQALCASARDQGIRIILDGVFSHTGDDSVYFNRFGNYPEPGAFSREESPYDSWYRFGDEYPGGYECWWGVDSLPNVEETDPDYQELICGENGVIRKWLRLGASGWRLDVADELPDPFITRIRAAARAEKPDALILGEVWEDASNKLSYGVLRGYLLGEELDCTMHYPFRNAAVDFMLGKKTAWELAETLESIREHYPPSALYGALNLLGSHDTPRILTVLGEIPEEMPEAEKETCRLTEEARAMAVERLKRLEVLQFFSPGVPCVYYGDEAGAEGLADPYNRGPFPWGREDQDLTAWVRLLSGIRENYPALVEGSVRYWALDDDTLGMERALGNVQICVYIGRRERTVPGDGKTWTELLTGTEYGEERLEIPLRGALALCHIREKTE